MNRYICRILALALIYGQMNAPVCFAGGQKDSAEKSSLIPQTSKVTAQNDVGQKNVVNDMMILSFDDKKTTHTYKYNADGSLKSDTVTVRNANGTIDHSVTTDAATHKTTTHTYVYNSDESLKSDTVTLRKANGTTEYSVTTDAATRSTTTHTYSYNSDSEESLKSDTVTFKNGEAAVEYSVVTDAETHKTTTHSYSYNPDKSLKSDTVTVKKSDGKIEYSVTTYADTRKTSTHTYSYNADGSLKSDKITVRYANRTTDYSVTTYADTKKTSTRTYSYNLESDASWKSHTVTVRNAGGAIEYSITTYAGTRNTSTHTYSYNTDSGGSLKSDKITVKNADGTAIYSVTRSYNYDSAGNLQKETATTRDSDGHVSSICATTYDSYGFLAYMSTTNYDSDGFIASASSVSKVVYNSDRKKETGVVTDVDASGNITRISSVAYNSDGREAYINAVAYDSYGDITSVTTTSNIVYDAEGNRLSYDVVIRDGLEGPVTQSFSVSDVRYEASSESPIRYTTTIKDPEDGRVTSIVVTSDVVYDADGRILSNTVTHEDPDGTILEIAVQSDTAYYEDGRIRSYDLVKKDADGNIISHTQYQTPFSMYNGTLYKDEDGKIAQIPGLDNIQMIYQSTLLPPTKDSAGTTVWPDQPDEARIKEVARGFSTDSYVILDIECWPMDDPATVDKLIQVINWVHEVNPELKVGYYSMVPDRNYWAPVQLQRAKQNQGNRWWDDNLAKFQADYKAWQAQNRAARKLAKVVDVICPSIYAFYDSQTDWRTYAVKNMQEAREYANGKPVLAFMWVQKEDAARTFPLVPDDYVKLMLDTILNHSDGAILWSFPAKWKDAQNQPWWPIVEDFIGSHP